MVRELRRMHRGMWALLGPLVIAALVVAVLTRPGPAIPPPDDSASGSVLESGEDALGEQESNAAASRDEVDA